MALHRLTSITLGVPDVAASTAFFRSFGLTDEGGGWLSTRDGGRQLQLAPSTRRGLHRLGVGATDADDLARIARRADDREPGSALEHTDALVALREPVTGVRVEITLADPLAPPPPPALAVNAPGRAQRRDVPAAGVLRDQPVRPSNLTHLVLGTPDQSRTLAFVTDVLGFEVSDQLPGIIAFTRCGEVHHNLAVQQAPVAFAHHVAFEVDDVDEVARGGTAMIHEDPERQLWGLGRHAIGSNWFWYLREPGGTFVEYTADVDRISAQDRYAPKDWQGHEFLYAFGPPPPADFLAPPDLADLVANG